MRALSHDLGHCGSHRLPSTRRRGEALAAAVTSSELHPAEGPHRDDVFHTRVAAATAGLPLAERAKALIHARLMDTIRRLRGSHLGSHRR